MTEAAVPAGEQPAHWQQAVDAACPGAAVRSVQRLTGGRTAHSYKVTTTTHPLVVKRYRAEDETADLEWKRLTAIGGAGLPSPAPLALDARGAWFGVPALAMSLLPGTPDLRPADRDSWLARMADALAGIHAVAVPSPPPVLRRPLATLTWTPPEPPVDTLVAAASAVLERDLPRVRWQPRLIHGDFHPGNLLWEAGRLTGVVDWSAARLGPHWYEVAYCRADIALLAGTAAADRFAQAYLAATGETPENLALFDLMAGLYALREVEQRVDDYRSQGSPVRPAQARGYLEEFLWTALDRHA